MNRQQTAWQKCVGLLLCLASICPVASAQVPSPQTPDLSTVSARLRSDTPSEIAWGAFLAAQYQLKDAVPLIVSRLEPSTFALDVDRLLTAAALLDSLVQLGARLPAASITPSCEVFKVQCVILLRSATDGRDEALLSLLETSYAEQWSALANALLETKSPQLAPFLLRRLQLQLDIFVSESGTRSAVSASGGLLHGDGAPWYRPDTFPPHAEYRFAILPRDGAIVLAVGPRVSYYTRDVIVDRSVQRYFSSLRGGTDQDFVDYLAALADLPTFAPHLRDVSFMTVEWRDAKDLLSMAAEGRAAVTRAYDWLVRTLVEKKRLTEEEKDALPPAIRVRVVDLRDNKTEPLPRIE